MDKNECIFLWGNYMITQLRTLLESCERILSKNAPSTQQEIDYVQGFLTIITELLKNTRIHYLMQFRLNNNDISQSLSIAKNPTTCMEGLTAIRDFLSDLIQITELKTKEAEPHYNYTIIFNSNKPDLDRLYHVFFSFSSFHGRALASKMRQVFTENSGSPFVFLDCFCLPPGVSITEACLNAVANTTLFVPLMTHHFLSRSHTSDPWLEYRYAAEIGSCIGTVLVDVTLLEALEKYPTDLRPLLEDPDNIIVEAKSLDEVTSALRNRLELIPYMYTIQTYQRAQNLNQCTSLEQPPTKKLKINVMASDEKLFQRICKAYQHFAHVNLSQLSKSLITEHIEVSCNSTEIGDVVLVVVDKNSLEEIIPKAKEILKQSPLVCCVRKDLGPENPMLASFNEHLMVVEKDFSHFAEPEHSFVEQMVRFSLTILFPIEELANVVGTLNSLYPFANMDFDPVGDVTAITQRLN